MSDNAEHRVEMHRIASARRGTGKPVWIETIDVSASFRNEAMSFTERRDAIVSKVKASRWYAMAAANKFGSAAEEELHIVVDNLADSPDVSDFDNQWNTLYDLADYARVWIKTF